MRKQSVLLLTLFVVSLGLVLARQASAGCSSLARATSTFARTSCFQDGTPTVFESRSWTIRWAGGRTFTTPAQGVHGECDSSMTCHGSWQTRFYDTVSSGSQFQNFEVKGWQGRVEEDGCATDSPIGGQPETQNSWSEFCPRASETGGSCTTQGSDGSCPDGTYPDGSGMCCSGGFCDASTLGTTGDAPATNMAPGPYPGPGGCGCDPAERTGCYSGGGEWSETSCSCVSPVLVDVLGDGFDLTDGAGGVSFDITADGAPDRISWTEAGSDDAWLALDRNGDGAVDSGAELFGNFTPQPRPPAGEQRNGFLALAVYDRAGNGGNEDGVIDARDAIFSALRLWRDADHDGESQPAELFTLPALDVVRLHLGYKESKRVDGHGNRFLYRAKLDDARGAKVNRWAWDVFLMRGQ